MAQYCTVQDVKAVASIISPDTRRDDPIDDALISSAIDEATVDANTLLQARYPIPFTDPIPPMAVNYTKYSATLILYFNMLQMVPQGVDITTRLQSRVKYFTRVLTFGNIFDSSDIAIDADPLVTSHVSESTSGDLADLQEIMEAGR